MEGSIVVLMLLGVAIYFAPLGVAIARTHHNTVAIGMLNLLLGWTLVGWVVALVWAFTNPQAVVVPSPSPTAIQPATVPQEGYSFWYWVVLGLIMLAGILFSFSLRA